MYQGRLPPFDHQREALARMQGMRAFALLLYMRTGKSKIVLDDFGQLELNGEVKDLLVLAPAGCYRTWKQQIDDHVAPELRQRLAVFTWETSKSDLVGFKEAAKAFLQTFNRPRVLLVNIEALSTPTRARPFCERFLRDYNKAMIVIDESTSIKRHKAARTKFINIHLAPLAKWKRILSGLPTPKSPLDYFSQFEFLDPRIIGLKNYYTFMHKYAKVEVSFAPHRYEKPIGFKNLGDLTRKIEPYCFRVPFRPKIPSTYTIREVELTDDQARLYAHMREFATAKLNADTHVTATVVIAQIMRLHQILCGWTKDELGNEHEIPEKRTNTLLDLLEDYSGKAVIWCSYDYNVRKIAEALTAEYGDGSTARFWGGNPETREEEATRFKNDQHCRFIIGTPSAGRFGRDWSEADLVIYYSSTNDLEHRDQSEMRVQGMMKERQVDYVDLIAPNTVEEKILQALRKKIDINAVLTGDAWRDWVV